MKAILRKKYRKVRAEMPRDEVAQKSQKAARYFIESPWFYNARVVMLYMPLGNEADTEEIIKAAYRDGKTVCFPITDESGVITPYKAEEDTSFEKGGFSVREPQHTEPIEKACIDVVVVPGIAFDQKGGRIGFGKGCYDRFLKETKALKFGYCYDEQVIEEVPSETNDIRMDYLITPSGITACKGEEK
ncbi:MAG: 5-formyltetrahydrofolate cyclo-ligase [Clostridia bacterium]|nr:5-formyltetrahydrofolate cyclo-ligase [Clostridia bacterium]